MKNLFFLFELIFFFFMPVNLNAQQNVEQATFAGGCFWCIEAAFDGVKGVISAESGYTGGQVANPTYEQVSTGTTGHKEAVLVTFDKSAIGYDALLDIFWKSINPTDAGGQFADQGSQYQTAIFYHTEEQKNQAEQSKKRLEESGIFDKPVVTPILKAETFYKAEDYHQDYAQKQSERYKHYKTGSGRAGFIEKTWTPQNRAVFCPLRLPPK